MEIESSPSHKPTRNSPGKQAICLSLKARDLVHTQCSPPGLGRHGRSLSGVRRQVASQSRFEAPADLGSDRNRMHRFNQEAMAVRGTVTSDVVLISDFK